MNRRTAREKAFQVLFQLAMNETNTMGLISESLQKEEQDNFLTMLTEGVASNLKEIDQLISEHLEKWSFQRIAAVERTILRIAAYEIQFMEDIPFNVSINEAVELANKYGDDRSGKFVNGVLSKFKK
ncbi:MULTISPECIES: transcription antitermination factor NusB [unclassified Virgibacillus]|uniref:transcription antitermination factor NusB n=1 Tax=unclassified Virgibacillus TaxID=2620237 RepID=UPI0024DEFC77|nr:transcription antitermination factor NusB [Virgibacillus sp. LDC-1]